MTVHLLHGNAKEVLIQLSNIDCVMTSPPYFHQRNYDGIGIGNESTVQEYLDALSVTFAQVACILKPQGSLWLNLGDKYWNKGLIGLPWRVAFMLMDHGWILRNSVVWNKMKGFSSAQDRLSTGHEILFHFVRQPKYYYDLDAIRIPPGPSRPGISSTGVSGKKYSKQIMESKNLLDSEKVSATEELKSTLYRMEQGIISDFRMILRGQHRVTHSDDIDISGRAKELEVSGYYFLTVDSKGSNPSDVWNIAPDARSKELNHFATYPEELCRIPILATCPPDGIVLDPFCGSGTTLAASIKYGRNAIGIDINRKYLEYAAKRCNVEEIE